MPLGMEIGLSPCDFVLGGDPAFPSQKGGRSPHQFSAHVYCGQMAGWIKMALGMEVDLVYCGQMAVCIRIPFGTEVGLSLGDIVLDGDRAPHPNFRPPMSDILCGFHAFLHMLPVLQRLSNARGF